MTPTWYRVGWLCVLAAHLAPAAPVVLDECDRVADWQVGRAPATVVAATDAAHGTGALQITLPGEVTRVLARSYVPEAASWDRAQGLSFWIKGDGSERFGCLAVTGAYPFVVYFPLNDTTWHQVRVPWADFVPELQVDPIGTPGSMPPSGISGLHLGSSWTIGHNNQPLPLTSFCIDRIAIEDGVPLPSPPPPPRPWPDVLAQLKARQPLRIQCVGDSITAGTGLPDRERQRYATLTQDLLRRWLGYADLTCTSRAVGGARSVDARAWVPRDFADAAVSPPDLVTLWIGYNDKSNAYTRAFFKASVNDYLDRVCRATAGRSAILLFATGPGCGPRFVMLDDYAEAIREIGRERGLPVFDVHRLLRELGRERLGEFFADMAHPNEAGHRFIAEALCEYLVREAGIDTPKPLPPPRPVVAPGESRAWDFEAGLADWRFDSAEVALAGERCSSGHQAVRFALGAPAADHRRAFSPSQAVLPGQAYRVTAQVYQEGAFGGSYGLFVLTYASADGSGEFTVLPVQRGPATADVWEGFAGRVEIPPGSASFRVMLWAARESVGTFAVDDVTVTPVEP